MAEHPKNYAVPSPTHPIWAELLQGKKDIPFNFLAARMALTLDRRKVAQGDPEVLKECARDLWRLFHDNARLGIVQGDLQKLHAFMEDGR